MTYARNIGIVAGMTIEQNFLTKAQATVYTSLSARSLDYARERQEIPFYKKGKRVLFKRADLDAWMERHRAGADLEKIVSEVLGELRDAR